MRLVPDWRVAWRWHSTQIFALLAVLLPVWQELPADLKAFLPPPWRAWVLGLIALAGVVLRLRDQSPK